jgi:HPt (histidine-containing phosphotransfer) domain-containing protein
MEAPGQDADAAATLALDAALARLEETVGDREFVAELIGDFLAALPAQLATLREACADGDLEQLHRGAHTLKSNAATFGAEDFALACRELERVAGAGQTAELQQAVARVEAAAARSAPGLAAALDERSS